MLTYKYGRLHAIGDSFTCREEDTGLDRGWQAFILQEHYRHGVSGSTAQVWANPDSPLWDKFDYTSRTGDTAIISLLGNDLMNAMKDGKLTYKETRAAVTNLRAVVKNVRRHNVTPVLLLYADPYQGKRLTKRLGVFVLRTLIKLVAFITFSGTFDTELYLGEPHFDGVGIHPTEEGHRTLARAIRSRWPKETSIS